MLLLFGRAGITLLEVHADVDVLLCAMIVDRRLLYVILVDVLVVGGKWPVTRGFISLKIESEFEKCNIDSYD